MNAAQKITGSHPFFPLQLQLLKQDIPVSSRHTETGGGLTDDRARRLVYRSRFRFGHKDFQLLSREIGIGRWGGGEPPDE